jgi:hypothetical protein
MILFRKPTVVFVLENVQEHMSRTLSFGKIAQSRPSTIDPASFYHPTVTDLQTIGNDRGCAWLICWSGSEAFWVGFCD